MAGGSTRADSYSEGVRLSRTKDHLFPLRAPNCLASSTAAPLMITLPSGPGIKTLRRLRPPWASARRLGRRARGARQGARQGARRGARAQSRLRWAAARRVAMSGRRAGGTAAGTLHPGRSPGSRGRGQLRPAASGRRRRSSWPSAAPMPWQASDRTTPPW